MLSCRRGVLFALAGIILGWCATALGQLDSGQVYDLQVTSDNELGYGVQFPITVTNNGYEDWTYYNQGTTSYPSYKVVFTNLTWTNGWEAGHSITHAKSNTIAAGASDRIIHILKNNQPPFEAPTNPGTYSVTIYCLFHSTVTSNLYVNMQRSPRTVNFSVTAAPAQSTIGVAGNLNFGPVDTNQTATATLTITNSGTGPFTVSSIQYPAGFSGAWTGAVPAASSRNVTVTFAPKSMQAYTGTVLVVSNAEGGNGGLACSGTGVGRVLGLTGSLSFGSLAVGETAAAALTLTNSGNGTLTITSIAYPAGFNGAWSGSLAAGKATNITVTFAPAAETTYSGSLTVNSDMTSGSNTLSVSGTGIGPTRIIGVSGNLAFSSVFLGQSKTAVLAITNSGNAALTVSGISYSNGFTGAWSGSIPAGGSRNVTVTFTPVAMGGYAGHARVQSDASSGSNVLACSGFGASRALEVLGNLAFGEVATGQTATAVMMLTNGGNAAITISNIVYPAGFTGSTNGRVPAGWLTNVTVSFSPGLLQAFGGTITVISDKTSGGNTIEASGTGAPPSRIIGLNALSFGDVVTGLTATASLIITNKGTLALAVSGISYPSGFSGAWSGGIPPHGSRQVPVLFAPSAMQNYSGTVTVASDAASGTNTTACSGTGIGRALAMNALHFGNIMTGQTAAASLSISNIGNAVLTVSQITCPTGFSGSWAGSIAAGRSTNVTITFAPNQVRFYSGSIHVLSDKTSGSAYSSVTGTGTGQATRILSLAGDLGFGNIVTGLTATAMLTLSNAGNETLTVDDCYPPPGFGGSWSGTLAPGASHEMTVTFAPTNMQSFGAYLTVLSDATSGPLVYPCSGTGIGRVIGISGNLSFGDVETNRTAQTVMIITNSGNAPLAVSDITYPAGFSGAWNGVLPVGGFTNVTLTFAPTETKPYGGTITVVSDKTSGNPAASVSGTGVNIPRPGQLCLSASSYAAQEGAAVKVKVRRINGSDGPVSVAYTVKPKTALAWQDYTPKSGTLSWANGDSLAKTIKIPVAADGKAEGVEKFLVLIRNPVGTVIANPSQAPVTIAANAKTADPSDPARETMQGLAAALDAEALTWFTSLKAPWSGQRFVTFDGKDAARSGILPGNATVSWLQTELEGPGRLDFDWTVKSSGTDSCLLFVDGEIRAVCAPDYGWSHESLIVENGDHTVRWVFVGNPANLPGAAYLDAIRWIPE